jgi:uncharacterized protein YbjT (DUF2867 family)
MSRFLIIGATGQQGGSVINALDGRGHDIVAFVRDDQSDKAQALAARGVDLVVGDLDDQASIETAFAGVDGAFAVTTFFTTSVDVEAEQGLRIADAAKTANLPYLVFSSVGSADESTGLPHFESKYRVEQRIRELRIPAAVVAPVWFMENVVGPWKVGDLAKGSLREAMPADQTLQLVSSVDIGKAAAAVLEQPQKFTGERVELIGDELTGPQMAEVLTAATGRPIEFEVQPIAELESMGDMVQMMEWVGAGGYSADADRLARDLPNVHFTTYKEWAAAQEWATILGAVTA